MTKARKFNEVFEDMMAGMTEALAVAEGRAEPGTFKIHVPETVDVKAIRKGQKLTQDEFAACYGFTVTNVRDWEQRRFAPTGAVRAYLIVIDRAPAMVRAALCPHATAATTTTAKPAPKRARRQSPAHAN